MVGFNGGQSPVDKERFINARAELYWVLREMFENGEIDLDPNDDQLAAQLGSIKWALDSKGRTKIESKDEMRKRGLPSPDRADAVMHTLLNVEAQTVDVESHTTDTITGGIMTEEW